MLAVRVQPGAPRDRLVGRMADGTLKLAVTAPPEGGRANEAVVRLLAAALGLEARRLRLKRGASGRSKVFEVEGLAGHELERRVDAALEGGERRKGRDGE
jgi:uncharacterized protein YggU (UPF0235/DUF167 family)